MPELSNQTNTTSELANPGRVTLALRASKRLIRQKPLGFAGALLLLFVTLLAVFAPWVAPVDPNTLTVDILQGPSGSHWLGTDTTGRDVFARVVWGGRVSLLVGVTATLLGTGTGAVIAVVTSYLGGKVDIIAQRFMDIIWAFPSLIVAMVLVFVIGSSTRNVIFAISIVVIPSAARVVRSQVLAVKEMEYTTAARAIGAGDWRIMVHHITRNCMAPYIIVASITLGGAITTEASLSFLGMGIPPPTPSWGRDLFGAARQYAELAPWMAIAPGVALSLAVYGFNLLGDAVRDVLDPRLRSG